MPYTSIREAAEEIHSGLLTPTELVLEMFERIDEQESDIQAYITVMRDKALEDADKAETELRTGLYRSQLHGIPIAIKDLIAVKGVRTTANSKVLEHHLSLEDAMVVEQLRKSGAIILGKTNTFEFAYGPYAPPTRNPWNRRAHNGWLKRWLGGGNRGRYVSRRDWNGYGWLHSYSGIVLWRDWLQADLWACQLLWRHSIKLVA